MVKEIDFNVCKNNLIELNIDIFNDIYKSCLDIGASRNYINKSVVQNFESKGHIVKLGNLSNQIQNKLADGTIVCSMNYIEIPVKIDSNMYMIDFVVFDRNVLFIEIWI